LPLIDLLILVMKENILYPFFRLLLSVFPRSVSRLSANYNVMQN